MGILTLTSQSHLGFFEEAGSPTGSVQNPRVEGRTESCQGTAQSLWSLHVAAAWLLPMSVAPRVQLCHGKVMKSLESSLCMFSLVQEMLVQFLNKDV